MADDEVDEKVAESIQKKLCGYIPNIESFISQSQAEGEPNHATEAKDLENLIDMLKSP